MKLNKKFNCSLLLVFALIGIIGLTVTAAPAPCPLISRGVPAYASSDYPSSANDNNYGSAWRGTIPGWIAFDLSSVPAAERGQVVVAWYNTDTYDYDHTIKNNYYAGILGTYTIEGNAAAGGGSSAPTSGWATLATVSGNVYHSRQSVVNLTGYNWVRLNISALDTQGGSSTCINVDIHNASQGVQDDWIFFGDSITAGGMVLSGTNPFAQMVNSAKPGYYPVAENGGIGGIFSWNGAQKINDWLAVFPGKYVGIAYGTNDCWGNQTGASAYYTHEETIVKAVLAAGKIPIVAKIPYSTNNDIAQYAPSYNAQIDALYAAYPQIVRGPDFWSFFKNNPSLLGGDGVHPSDTGYVALRQEWANVALASIYTGSTNTPTPTRGGTPTPTRMATPTSRPTSTQAPTQTPTMTPTPTRRKATPTPTRRGPTPTPTFRPSSTPTRRVSVTPTPTSRMRSTQAPTMTPTPTRSNTPTPTRGSGNYVISYVIQSDWGSGATINVTIINNTTAAVNGWTLAWTFPGNQTITNLWNGAYTQSGASVSVKDSGFNASITASGGTVNFGFNLNYSGANTKPSSFTLNGMACQIQ